MWPWWWSEGCSQSTGGGGGLDGVAFRRMRAHTVNAVEPKGVAELAGGLGEALARLRVRGHASERLAPLATAADRENHAEMLVLNLESLETAETALDSINLNLAVGPFVAQLRSEVSSQHYISACGKHT